MEKDKKLTYVEMRYSDGSAYYIKGKKANEWLDNMNGCCMMAAIHGCGMESFEWKEIKNTKERKNAKKTKS